MRSSTAQVGVIVLVALALVAIPARAASYSYVEWVVHRTVASPVPQGVLTDEATFLVNVSRGDVVRVYANSSVGTAFTLHYQSAGAADGASAVPSNVAAALLSGPRSGSAANTSWLVTMDPVVGVNMDVHLALTGYVSDVGGASAEFDFTPLTDARQPCVVGPSSAAEVCLP